MNTPLLQRCRLLPWMTSVLALGCQWVLACTGVAQETSPKPESPPFLTVRAHSYDSSTGRFETAWKLFSRLPAAKKEDWVVDTPAFHLHTTPDGRLRSVWYRMGKMNALIVVHFEKERRDDVTLVVISKKDLPSHVLIRLIESIPDTVGAESRKEGHILKEDGVFDFEVEKRDFDVFEDWVLRAGFEGIFNGK